MICNATPETIAKAATLLREGKLVAFPTETVYGLGADATNNNAVAAVFDAKTRPRNNPLIIHVKDVPGAKRYAEFSEEALKLANAFWPGPLTLVLPKHANTNLSDLVSPNTTTLAVRIPDGAIASALLKACNFPIAAPSANRSGHVSPTRAQHVADDLGDRVAMILDGGPCHWGVESTVLNMTSSAPIILRTGAITKERIEAALNQSVAYSSQDTTTKGAEPLSPGMTEYHYAPNATLRLGARKAEPGEAFLAFGPTEQPHDGPTFNLSEKADLIEAAANLYTALRSLDQSGLPTIAVMPIPHEGLGITINDRLKRAAAPRR